MKATSSKAESQSSATAESSVVDVPSPAVATPVTTQVVFSIPRVTLAGDRVFTESDASLEANIEAKQPANSGVVTLSVSDGSVLQTCVQNMRQSLVSFAGGSAFWRLFVGTGFAVFVGALTLILLGPDPEQSGTESAVSKMETVDQGPPPQAANASRPAQNPPIKLTVSTHDLADGPIRVEVEDPFTDENLVRAKTVHAVHFSEEGEEDGLKNVRQVSQDRATPNAPAWLTGTIE